MTPLPKPENFSLRTFFNAVIKAIVMTAFYVAGILTAYQILGLTIDSQRARINELERETDEQRIEIDALTKKVSENSESLKTILVMKNDIETIKQRISEFHRGK